MPLNVAPSMMGPMAQRLQARLPNSGARPAADAAPDRARMLTNRTQQANNRFGPTPTRKPPMSPPKKEYVEPLPRSIDDNEFNPMMPTPPEPGIDGLFSGGGGGRMPSYDGSGIGNTGRPMGPIQNVPGMDTGALMGQGGRNGNLYSGGMPLNVAPNFNPFPVRNTGFPGPNGPGGPSGMGGQMGGQMGGIGGGLWEAYNRMNGMNGSTRPTGRMFY